MPFIDDHTPRVRRAPRACVSRFALSLALFPLAFGAGCSDESASPVAPATLPVPSLGVNNGGNNRRILFTREGSIYSMNPDGTGVTQLTTAAVDPSIVFDQAPAWSPDGKRVAFVRFDSSDPSGDIYVMDADGRNVSRVTNSPGNDLSPTWSKDGKRIAFVSTRGDASPSNASSQAWDIYAMDLDGNNVIRLTNTSGADFDPAWSPDGKQIAFVSGRDAGGQNVTDLYTVTLDGLLVTRLTNEGTNVLDPSWAPGGKQIAFTGGDFEASNTDVFVVNADGTQLTRITDGPDTAGSDLAPSWSPDGKQIAFTSSRANGNIFEVYIMNANGTAVTRLTRTTVDNFDPAWNR
jgi:Tol biopolymer transport system component